MKKEMVMVKDADGEELYINNTIGMCVQWCEEHNITGENGEYIAIGMFDEVTRYFEVYDYATII